MVHTMHIKGFATLKIRACDGTGSHTNKPRPAPEIVDSPSVSRNSDSTREGIANVAFSRDIVTDSRTEFFQ